MGRVVTVALAVLVVGVLAPLAVGKAKPKPPVKLVGNYGSGIAVFNETCATCHLSSGIGPPLSHINLTEPQIVAQINNGGSAFMGAAAANYATTMPGFKGTLSPAEINNVAALVWMKIHNCPAYVVPVVRGGYTYTKC